jgi:Transposase IS200 like
MSALLISKFVGQVKGGSAHDVNEALGGRDKVLHWQTGYGVVSFGTRRLDWVVEYIRNQREHHAQRTVHERLERITQDDTQQAQVLVKSSQREDRERASVDGGAGRLSPRHKCTGLVLRRNGRKRPCMI